MPIENNIYEFDDDVDLTIASQTFVVTVDAPHGMGDYWSLQPGTFGSANFQSAWAYATGRGVTIGLVDEGVNYTHLDLAGSYSAAIDFDPRDIAGSMDARPDSSEHGHGTKVAGIIAGNQANTIGTIGAAPDATITASYLRYGSEFSMSDLVAIMAHQAEYDVSNNSWGFTSAFADNFNSSYFDGLADGISITASTGRDGLGTALVMAAGNGKILVGGQNVGDDSNFHNLSNSRFVIAVGAHDSQGEAAYFSSPGTNVLVSAPGVSLLTTEGTGTGANTSAYASGTSFAAPMVSSAIALMLEVNPNLGYRDIQEILAISADPSRSGHTVANGATNVNGGGMMFDREMGFGALNAEAAVNLARTWTSQSTAANEDHIAATFATSSPADPQSETISVTVTDPGTGGFSLDFVQLSLEVYDVDLKTLSIELISPDGTHALIAPNLTAAGNRTNLSFTFSSVATWGESPYGTWTLKLNHSTPSRDFTLIGASLDLYGDITNADDTYYYTGAYARLVAADGSRSTTTDADGGSDTLNFAAAGSGVVLDLSGATSSRVGSTALTLNGSFEAVIGSVYADRLAGSVDSDVLSGDFGKDTVLGADGDDFLDGGNGDDLISGGSGADAIDGGSGVDTATYSTAVTLDFSTGGHLGDATGDTFVRIERFSLSADADSFVGSLAAVGEQILGNAGDDSLNGGGGNDRLDGGQGADTMIGGTGNDTFVVDSVADLIVEVDGEGTDTVMSTFNFALSAALENLTLAGDATVGLGNDGSNTLTGNSLGNTLRGNRGSDTILGMAGNDVITGGAGSDRMAGGLGNDTYIVDGRGDQAIEALGQGRDTVSSSVSFRLGTGVENLYLSGNMSVSAIGNALRNRLVGNGADNLISGAGGTDRMFGGAGDDTLIGGKGRDFLTGGSGHDTFDFNTVAESRRGQTRDVITDFRHQQDRLDLSDIDASTTRNGNQTFRLIGDDDFSGVAGQIHFTHVNGSTLVLADVDGDGRADLVIALRGHIELTARDFIL